MAESTQTSSVIRFIISSGVFSLSYFGRLEAYAFGCDSVWWLVAWSFASRSSNSLSFGTVFAIILMGIIKSE